MVNYSGTWAKGGNTKRKQSIACICPGQHLANSMAQVAAGYGFTGRSLCLLSYLSDESFSSCNQTFLDVVLLNFSLLRKARLARQNANFAMRTKKELATLSLDVIQDSWRCLTHKSGQNMSAIGYYATFFARRM